MTGVPSEPSTAVLDASPEGLVPEYDGVGVGLPVGEGLLVGDGLPVGVVLPVGVEPPVGEDVVPGFVAGTECLPPAGDEPVGVAEPPGICDGEADGGPVEGATDAPGSSSGVVSRTLPGSWVGTPGTGSTALGANGVAPMKLSTSTVVYPAHSVPAA
ncbi:hypothetical protein [Streptomyces sp. Act143]|uniref:hypothetical protein n=1 Tax=Streptomyces sp. Act143 TaxID=2200760 RepID=UPI0011B58117|nr:hypothetical protein [Streptomyces sp. Act143]